MSSDQSAEQKDNVVEITPATKRVEPVQFTCRMILDKGCDISATTAYYPREGENANAILDGMVSAMERQKALNEIKLQYKEIEDAEMEAEVNIKDLEARIEKFPAEVEQLNKDLESAKANYTRQYKVLQEKTENAGRIFEPTKPGNHRELNPLLVAVNELEEKIKQKQHEHDTDIMTTKRGIEITNFRVTKAKAKIDKLLKVVNG